MSNPEIVVVDNQISEQPKQPKQSEPPESIDLFDQSAHVSNETGPWNYKILLLLTKIANKTMTYRWLHEQEAKYYEDSEYKINLVEMLVLAFYGTITGINLIDFLSDNKALISNPTYFLVMSITQMIVVFVTYIIKGYRDVKKYTDNRNNHTNASIKNAELNLLIQFQLSLDTKDRDIDHLFLKSVISKFNDILIMSPNIRDSTRQKYLELYAQTDITDNNIFGPIVDIYDHIIAPNNSLNSAIDKISANKISDQTSNDAKMRFHIDRWLRSY